MRRPAYQAQGRATTITGSCTVGPRWAVVRSISNGVYERVQPRLPEVSRCKSALFRSPKGSQYQLVEVVSDTKLSQSCCSARDLLYIIRISRVTNSTNTDFSRDLQYKIRVFINCACVPGFSIDCCTLFKCRCMIKPVIGLVVGIGHQLLAINGYWNIGKSPYWYITNHNNTEQATN